MRAADERTDRPGQIGVGDRPKRREAATAQLVQRHRLGDVLEPMLAELLQRHGRLDEGPRRLRHDDLPAIRRRSDPRRNVDDLADIALVGHQRDAGVESDSDKDRAAAEGLGQFVRGGECVGGRREGHEERVALGVDFGAAVCAARRPDDPAVLGERHGVRVRAELSEQPCRAFDVAGEEGDRPGRQIRSHPPSMAARDPSVKMQDAAIVGSLVT